MGATPPPRSSESELVVAPAHRGRGESCTLRILADAFTGAHKEEREKKQEQGKLTVPAAGAHLRGPPPSFGATLDCGG